jgi:hypothetical protein
MPADETFGAPIVEQIDGRDVEFPRLYMDFYGTLEAAVRNQRNAVAKAACDESQVIGKDRAEFLRDAAKQPVMPEDVDEYLHTKEGFTKAIKKSLELASASDAKEILDKMDTVTAIRIARMCIGFVRAVPSDEEFVDTQGPPKERNWDAEWSLIVKHVPTVANTRLTWHQYHLCLARARASERANPASE